MIDVVVAHAEPLVRAGMRAALEEAGDCRVVAAVGDARALEEAVAGLAPRVALLEVRFQRADPGLLRRLTEAHPATAFAVMVEHSAEECVLRAVGGDGDGAACRLSPAALARSGECCLTALRDRARGCIPRAATPEHVVQVVRLVAAGEVAAGSWLSAGWAEAAAPEGRRGGEAISAREMEVIGGVSAGMSNKEIGRRLGIHEQTVKNHLARIMRKLGVENRVELAIHARKRHLA